MPSSTFFSVSPYYRETYHVADLDKASPNRLFKERDNREEMRKGHGDRAVVPVYKYETHAIPELQNVPRGADNKNRVLEDRRQSTFNKSASEIFMARPLG